MIEGLGSWYRKRLSRVAREQWQRAAGLAGTLSIEELRRLHGEARRTRAALDDLLHVAEGRLTRPLETAGVEQPPLSDWAWRPEAWSGPLSQKGLAAPEAGTRLGREIAVFHDSPGAEIVLRQMPNLEAERRAPWGLRVEVFGFTGNYLSLAIDLPDSVLEGLRKTHLLRLDTAVDTEKPLEVFARLNVRHGPNTEQLVREFDLRQPEIAVEFDLAYTAMNEKRVERLWLDLILESPSHNLVRFRDVRFSRRPRAGL